MNQLAEEHQFLVVYQPHSAPPAINPMSCWDFFLPGNWRRGSGEPASLAGIVQDMLRNTSRWTIDRQRIYVAGISSGGGETANLGATYPDVFAAIAVHSGGEYGYFPQLLGAPAPAPDVLAPAPDALEPLSEEELASGEMKLRTGLLPKGPDPEEQGKKAFQAMGHFARVVPTIVFHGTDDHVCDPENGDQVTRQWITTNSLASGGDFTAAFEHPSSTTSHPAGPHGERPYTADTWQDVHGRDVVTYYRIDGMDHAWSGGTPGSILTDPSGPDASKIIYEFFMAHPNPEPAGERGPLAAAPQVTLAELDRRLARIEALHTAAPATTQQRAAGTSEPESRHD